ncbi:MAG: NAD(P)/FAD-dependent oxidoreductase, partial [Calditrichaeota bacterium]|nr:NAD(P)/FAD-dependent oxidoreductase [Calditrichota bacterium]
RLFVIVGAGASGNAAAQSLREAGFQGRIMMITREKQLPYDRPNLSKDYLEGKADPAWMPLRSEDFYEEHGIELRRKTEVKRLNIPTKTVTFSDGETVIYDKLLIASGAVPANLPVDGANLKKIFTLRTFDDSDAIIKASEDAREAVIIGTGFIGMETAHSLSRRGLKVTVVSKDSVPFEHVFGQEIGELFRKSHEENGVLFKMNTGVKKFEGKDAVESVILSNEEKLKADLVIVAIGVTPETGFIQGLEFAQDGGIPVDKFMKAGEDIYAAGDVARFPFWLTGKDVRIEHWRLAEQLGRVAGRNMAGKKAAYNSVPFFWTNQAGLYFRYVGHAVNWDDIIIDGNVSRKDFLAYYLKKGVVCAIAGTGRDKELAAAHELFRTKKMPSPEHIRNHNFKLSEYLKK